MTALESFAAFTNELSEIPGRMLEGWRDLTRLCLWTNKLTAMPPEIGCMHNLQVHGLLILTEELWSLLMCGASARAERYSCLAVALTPFRRV